MGGIIVLMSFGLPGSFTGGRAGTFVRALPNFVRLIWRVICELNLSPPEQEGSER